VQTTCSKILNSHFLRNIVILLVISLGVAVYTSLVAAESASRSRIEWTASLNEPDSDIQFTAVGPTSRTLLVTIFPYDDRVEQDALESEILHDADARRFRKDLIARGFTAVRVGSGTNQALLEENQGRKLSAVAVASGRV
jgi:hypothetical protein